MLILKLNALGSLSHLLIGSNSLFHNNKHCYSKPLHTTALVKRYNNQSDGNIEEGDSPTEEFRRGNRCWSLEGGTQQV